MIKMPALFDLRDRVAVMTHDWLAMAELAAALRSDWPKLGLPSTDEKAVGAPEFSICLAGRTATFKGFLQIPHGRRAFFLANRFSE
ncbi:MAG: hypothetical protein ABSA57_15040 [Candidatus Acidiferrales bacterium]